MTEDKLMPGGAVCYWRLPLRTHRQQLKDNLTAVLLGSFVPSPPTPLACLRATLAEVYPSRQKLVKHIIRPLDNGRKGFAVVADDRRIEHHVGDDWGRVLVTAEFEGKDTGRVALEPYDHDAVQRIEEETRNRLEWVSGGAVASTLRKIAEEMCDGVSLRPSGGIYWIRDEHLKTWQYAGVAVQRAGEKGESDKLANAVYALRVPADDEMVRAVGDALASEVFSELTLIEHDIKDGDLREGACLTRLKRTGQLEAKVKRYEAAFSSSLESLRKAIQRTSVAAAQATIQASASAVA